jgi:hypothetical protein
VLSGHVRPGVEPSSPSDLQRATAYRRPHPRLRRGSSAPRGALAVGVFGSALPGWASSCPLPPHPRARKAQEETSPGPPSDRDFFRQKGI